MPRKGVAKVRTGCLTCKKRKVKCDETRPSCNRCSSTGRTCDGYMPPPPGCMSWARLLSPPVAGDAAAAAAITSVSASISPATSPSAFPDADGLELRSLAFYHQVVAPALCGPLHGSSFWTRLVAQMSHSEPATRHAVLAISRLYENFDPGGRTRGGDCDSQGSSSGGYTIKNTAAGVDDDFAIRHYNAAISHLVNLQPSRPADLDTVLLVCILFTCIEFLRGDADSAIRHSQHGISLLNSGDGPSRRELVAVFRHLSIFPYFFGGQISAFPVLRDQQGGHASDGLMTADEATSSLDGLLARAVRLVRASDVHRLGLAVDMAAQSVDEVAREQHSLKTDLKAWRDAFDERQAAAQRPEERERQRERQREREREQMALWVLEMRWLVCYIWADTCLSGSETVYDEHMDGFARIVDLATLARAQVEADAAAVYRQKFTFVMGFSPLLYFVAVKCRDLRLRLAALELLRTLACVRETLWDATTLYAVGRLIVEREHGVEVVEGMEGMEADACEAREMPLDEARVRDSAVEVDGGDGGRRVCLLMLGAEGIYKVYGWIA